MNFLSFHFYTASISAALLHSGRESAGYGLYQIHFRSSLQLAYIHLGGLRGIQYGVYERDTQNGTGEKGETEMMGEWQLQLQERRRGGLGWLSGKRPNRCTSTSWTGSTIDAGRRKCSLNMFGLHTATIRGEEWVAHILPGKAAATCIGVHTRDAKIPSTKRTLETCNVNEMPPLLLNCDDWQEKELYLPGVGWLCFCG